MKTIGVLGDVHGHLVPLKAVPAWLSVTTNGTPK
jgi:hypothetical protein